MPISFLLYPQVKCTTNKKEIEKRTFSSFDVRSWGTSFFYLNIEVLIIYLPRFTFQSQISLPEYFS